MTTGEVIALIKALSGGGGSGNRFVVTFTQNEDESWSADKTFAECVAAWEAGQTMFAFCANSYYPLAAVYLLEDEDVTYISFGTADAESGVTVNYGIDPDGAYFYRV